MMQVEVRQGDSAVFTVYTVHEIALLWICETVTLLTGDCCMFMLAITLSDNTALFRIKHMFALC